MCFLFYYIMKILIVEDEFALLQTLEESLKTEGYVVETAATYNMALDKVSWYEYDCVLLDIGLPGGSGLQLLEYMKENNRMSNVIIISAKDSIEDKIAGLDLGADDYLSKPFHLAELHARIKAVIRRKNFSGNRTIKIENLEVDYTQKEVRVDGVKVPLWRKEYDILVLFLANMNRVLSKESIAENVWGDNMDVADNFDFVYVQLKNLRKHLKDSGANISIESIYGMGYKCVINS